MLFNVTTHVWWTMTNMDSKRVTTKCIPRWSVSLAEFFVRYCFKQLPADSGHYYTCGNSVNFGQFGEETFCVPVWKIKLAKRPNFAWYWLEKYFPQFWVANAPLHAPVLYAYSVSNPPEVFWNFSKRVGNFLVQILHALICVPICTRLQIFIQLLPATLTKLCNIKCDHPACVSADCGHFEHMMWTGWSRLIWRNFVKVADNWIKICT